MTTSETRELLQEECRSSPIPLVDHGQHTVAIKPSHCQANEILLRIALSGWRSAAEYWNTQPIPLSGVPLDFLDLESDL